MQKSKSFYALFWTQFLGAFNDNLFKNILVLLIAYKSVSLWGVNSQGLVAMAGGVFILPFFLFSSIAGQLADKIDKSRLIQWTKIWEILVMACAGIGFFFDSFAFLMLVLFLMGTQSAFFGPVKYSVLPEILSDDQLMSGNAYVEMGTFLAILLGTVAGGVFVSSNASSVAMSAGVLFFAGLGYVASRGVAPLQALSPELKVNWNPFTSMAPILRVGRKKKSVWYAILSISLFWFFGAAILSLLPNYGKDFLGVNEAVTTFFLGCFTVGIGIGSFLCERLSKGKVDLKWVSRGAVGMAVFMIDLSFAGNSFEGTELLGFSEFFNSFYAYRVAFDFLMIPLFGGIFIVPLYAFVQKESDPVERSQAIAATNIMNALFMVGAAVILMVLGKSGLSFPGMFLVVAGILSLASVFLFWRASSPLK